MKTLIISILALRIFNCYAMDVPSLETLCSQNDGNACEQAGTAYLKGEGVEKSNEKAAELFEKACRLKVGRACACLVDLYVADEGNVPGQDAERAAEYHKKACDYGWSPSCVSLGIFYSLGLGVQQSKEEARKLFERACSMKDGTGCYNLGSMFASGEGGEKSAEKAMEYFQKGCERKNEDACLKIGKK